MLSAIIYSFYALVILGLWGVIAWRNWGRRKVISHFARDVAKKISPSRGNTSRNLCCNGGYHGPMCMKWQTLYETWFTSELKNCKDSNEIYDRLFKKYARPLEKWLQENMVGQYAYWANNDGVYLLLTDEQDMVFYYMRFGDEMPTASDLKSLGV